ncbi:M48 family metalloprotease [Streptomyces sp. NPDC002851]
MTTPPEPAYPEPKPEPEPEPGYPKAAPPEPAYPEPEYPQHSPTPEPEPTYPQAPPHQPPPQPSTPPTPPPPQPQQPQQPEQPQQPSHPHDISFDQRRIHLSDRQRGADAATVGGLLLHIPNFLGSLLVVSLVSLLFGGIGFLVVLAWLLSGLLVFHRPTESVIARHLLRLRYPTPEERARLEPVWREVTARAGVDGRTYELWVEDSDDLNAVAAAGHIVGVTRFAMNRLPSGQLAAVLAHELGHHTGGHSWSSLLGYWYALPGRFAWRLLRAVAFGMLRVSRAFSCFGVGFVLLVFGAFTFTTLTSLYGLPLLLLVIPYLIAAVGRRAELRADQQAAALGFAPMLAEVLATMHAAEEEQLRAAVRAAHPGVPPDRLPPPQQAPLAKLLSSHPDYHTRLHHLQPYLGPSR